MNYDTPSRKSAQAIRGILFDRHESIESLAAGTGIALSTLKRRLLGASPFTIDELGLIAAYFDVPILDVMTPKRQTTPTTPPELVDA
jgi:transcriptional regulator with XRE-family HTH domain